MYRLIDKGHRVNRSASRLPRAVSTALLSAGLLCASLPLGFGAAPAAAADVTAERLHGATRYETAVAIAERYVTESGTAHDAAIVVSGDDRHAPCALASATLSSFERAPVLLTQPDSLTAATREFLTRHGIGRLFIVGGTVHVSSAVEEELREATGASSARLGGDDCISTAAAVARHVGTPGLNAARKRTVLLTRAEAIADGLAAGSVAYRAKHPLLLTRSHELDSAVSDLIRERADHVIILGGTSAVSRGVEAQVTALGVTTERWSGHDRFATAARVAWETKAYVNSIECTVEYGVGLATGFRAADAIASAPLLGQRCHPLLLTEPTALSQPSASALTTGLLTGGVQARLHITVFGGTAAVTAATQRAAIDAASTDRRVSDQVVSTRVTATEGACHWTVDFDRPVESAAAGEHSNYAFGSEALSASVADIATGGGDTTRQVVILIAGAGPSGTALVPSDCGRPLAVRDRLSVLAGAIPSADGTGTNAGAELIVRADTTRPRLTVVPARRHDAVWVFSSEPLAAGTATVKLTRSRASKTQKAVIDLGDTYFRVSFSFPSHDSYEAADLPFTEPPWLSAGDMISVASSMVRDRAGNSNSAVSHRIVEDTAPPKVSSVAVSAPTPYAGGGVSVDVTVRWSEPVQGCALGPGVASIKLERMTFDIDSDGFAEFGLDGFDAARAGVSFIDAADDNQWIRPGEAACDQSWWESDGTLVARLAAASPSQLPRAGSRLVVTAGAARDFAGIANETHAITATNATPR